MRLGSSSKTIDRTAGFGPPVTLAKMDLMRGLEETGCGVARLIPLVLAAMVGLLTIDAGFVYDDRSALEGSALVAGDAHWSEAFTRDYWGKPIEQGVNSWRPIMPMVWAGMWALWPNNPLPFHLLSALLHVLAVAVSMRLARALRDSEAWAIGVGALFAVHPLNAEAVGAIVAQADLLSFSLVLGACLIALRPAGEAQGISCAVVLLVASLVKESAMIFAPLLVLLIALQRRTMRERLAASLPSVAVAVVVIAFQLIILTRRETVALFGNSLAHQAVGWQRVLLGLHTIGRSIVMTVWPAGLAPSHGYAAIELQTNVLWPFAAVGAMALALGIAAGWWAVRRRSAEWIAALSFLYGPALLQSHWFVRLITDLAERLLYPATLGIAMIATSAIFALFDVRAQKLVTTALVVLAFVVALPARRAWASDYALWSHAEAVEPKAMRHQFNLSNALIRSGELDGAVFHRLVAMYLVNRFPKPVEWEKVEAVRRLPASARFVELPGALFPESPCPIVVAFLRQNEQIPDLHDHALRPWLSRYPQCFGSAR